MHCSGEKLVLTHWGRVTHICVSDLNNIGPYNGLSPARRQAIIWTSAGILLTGPIGTKFSEILIEIHTSSLKKIHWKMASGKWRLFRLGLNVLMMFTLFPGYDLMSSSILYYKNGRRAILNSCMDAKLDNIATVMGSTGHITVSRPAISISYPHTLCVLVIRIYMTCTIT